MNENPITKLNECLKKNPSRVAICREGEELTYEDIEFYSNWIGNRLGSIFANKFVAFYLKDTLYTLCIYIGIYKAGAIPVPLTNSMEITESYQRMDDIDVCAILTDENKINRKKLKTDIEIIELPQIEEIRKEQATLKFNNGFPHTVNLLPTSGTTGKPKKVQVTLENLNWIMREYRKNYGLDERSRMLYITDYSWDVSMPEIMAPIYIGLTSFTFPKDLTGIQKTKKLAEITKQHQLTFLALSPSYTFAVAKSLCSEDFKSVNTVVLGGENFSIQLIPILKNLFSPDTKIFNLYGPTETTVAVTTYEITGLEKNVVPIGKPFDGVKIKVLDKNNKEVRKGNLHISGECLTLGYTNKEYTKESFIEVDGEIYYRTGDIVYFDDDSNLVFDSRIDDQISYHGTRIELREIEETIRDRIGFSQVVSAFEDNKLLAFIINDIGIEEIVVQKRIEEIFPPHYHVIPIFVKEFLFNDHSKVDKKKMLAIYYHNRDTSVSLTNKSYDELIKKFEELLRVFGFRNLEEMDSLDKVRFLIDFEDFTGVEIPEGTVEFLINNSSFKKFLFNFLNEEQNLTYISGNNRKYDDLFLEQVEEYSDLLSIDSSFETMYLTKNYKQRQYRSYFIFDLKILSSYSSVRKIIMNNLKILADHVDIFNLVMTDDCAESFSKIDKFIPYIFKVENFPSDGIIKEIFEKPGKPLIISVFNTTENILRFYISHYVLDLSSFAKLSKYLYNVDQLEYQINFESSFQEYVEYIKNQSKEFRFADNIEEYIPNSYKISELSRNKIQILEEQFDCDLFYFNKSTSYSLQAFFKLSQKIFEQNPMIDTVTGSIICDIREFENLNATNIIGDIHSTLPVSIKRNDSFEQLCSRFDNIFKLYKKGINLKEIAFETKGKLLERWNEINFAINFLGEVNGVEEVIERVKMVEYDEKHIVVMSNQNQFYIVISSELLEEVDYTCLK